MQTERKQQVSASPTTGDTERTLGKNLPASMEAERAVLSAILLNDDCIAQLAEIIGPDDFYAINHKLIYQAVVDIAHEFKRVDLVTLQDELAKRGQLEVIGGVLFLLSLQEDIPAVGLIEQHARIIKEKAVLRELITSAAGIITTCYSQDDKHIDSVLDNAEKTIFQIANKRTNQSFVQLNIWLKKTFKHLSSIKSSSKGVTGIPSGFKKLDAMSSGFQNGDLVILAARPSMGKTALALGMALNAAEQGASVGVFSLEMSAEQLSLRLLSAQSGIAHHNIRNASLSSQEWVGLTGAAAQLSEMKILLMMRQCLHLWICVLKRVSSKRSIIYNCSLSIIYSLFMRAESMKIDIKKYPIFPVH